MDSAVLQLDDGTRVAVEVRTCAGGDGYTLLHFVETERSGGEPSITTVFCHCTKGSLSKECPTSAATCYCDNGYPRIVCD